MKNYFPTFVFLILLIPPSMLWGTHIGFTEHAISTSADWVYSVHAADVDGDGDMDVLSASTDDDKIAWYEHVREAPEGYTYVPDDNFEQALIDLDYDEFLSNYFNNLKFICHLY